MNGFGFKGSATDASPNRQIRDIKEAFFTIREGERRLTALGIQTAACEAVPKRLSDLRAQPQHTNRLVLRSRLSRHTQTRER